MKYSDGTAISIGDRVMLANNEPATVDALFCDLNAHYPTDGFEPNTPGVLVVTDNGARVLLHDLQQDDLWRSSE